VGTCNGVASAPPPADLICQWLTLRTAQHGLRFHTRSEPKAHCGLSQWRALARVGPPLATISAAGLPMAILRIALHNPIQSVCWH
jgi:hypothetical protein